MKLLKELQQEKNNLFQFYIIIGDGEKNREIIKSFLENDLELNLKNNFFLKIGDDLKIDEARNIKRENSYSNDLGKQYKKIYFLDYKKINLESQNALLKTFEEVGENSHFFLFVPSKELIIDTIKSRGRVIQGEKEINLQWVKDFKEMNFSQREKFIEKIDKNNISLFINSLETLILENRKNIDIEFYKKFLDLKQHIFNKGVSLKNLLIWIAINF